MTTAGQEFRVIYEAFVELDITDKIVEWPPSGHIRFRQDGVDEPCDQVIGRFRPIGLKIHGSGLIPGRSTMLGESKFYAIRPMNDRYRVDWMNLRAIRWVTAVEDEPPAN